MTALPLNRYPRLPLFSLPGMLSTKGHPSTSVAAIDGRVPLPAAVPSTVASYRLLWKKSSGPCPLMAPV